MSDGVHLLIPFASAAVEGCARGAAGPGPAATGSAARAPEARATRTRGDGIVSVHAARARAGRANSAMPRPTAASPGPRWQVQPGRPAMPQRRGLGPAHAVPLAAWQPTTSRMADPQDLQLGFAATRTPCSRRCSPSSSRTASRWTRRARRCGWPGARCSATCHRLARPRGRPHRRRLAAARRGRQGRCAGCSSEMQMLLYTHASTRRAGARAAAGQFLLAQRHRRPARPPLPPAPPGLQITHYLRDAALRGRLARLGRGLAAARCERMRAAVQSAATRARPMSLTLCGERMRRRCRAATPRSFAPHGQACSAARAHRPCCREPMKIITRDMPPRAAWALEQAGVHPLLARLFAARGVLGKDELDDGLARLLPPGGLHGLREAAVLLADASRAGKQLCIVADYDCDGATACAVALRGLRLLGRAARGLRGARPRGARLRPDAADRRAREGARRRRADHGRQRHRQRRGRGARRRRWACRCS